MRAGLIAERFEVVALAGQGGMGRVYRARDHVTGAAAAVKVLRAEGVERARFEREGCILAELSHPGIVRYLSHGVTAEGEPFLAMEWLEGEDLGRRLKRRALSLTEAVTLGVRVGQALETAHLGGVVHRDIKPGNLFLSDGQIQRVKVIDFGIARPGRAAPALTYTGMMLGTPAYMSPEQARGYKDVGPQADVFSLGCVLFCCLAGRPPFQGEDVLAVLMKLALEEAPRLCEIRGDVPAALDDLVARMLAKDPAERPQSAGAVVEELSRIEGVASEDVPGEPVPSVRPAAVSAAEQRVLCLLVARTFAGGAAADLSASRMNEAEADLAESDLAAAVDRYGGTLHVVADGSLFVTMHGASLAEHAVRAARCALAVGALLRGASLALVAGRAVMSGAVPMGAAIDRAAQLASAGGGGIRLDDVFAGLLDERFDVARDASGATLLRELDRAPGARTLLGAPSRCVGRDREILRLLSIFEECASESAARAVLVTAPAGTGKSRLRYELLRKVRESLGPELRELRGTEPHESLRTAPHESLGTEPHESLGTEPHEAPPRIWIAQGDPMRAGSPFAILTALLRGSDEPGAPLSAAAAALSAELSAPQSAGRSDPGARRAKLLALFLDWLRDEATRGPVLFLVDDLHWGDLPSVSFFDAALRELANLPIFVLALARPEVHDAFPMLWTERAFVEVKLGPLSRRAALEMARSALPAGTPLPVIDALVARGAGNAFYLEELIRAVSEGRGGALPETVLAVVEGRLARLDPGARRVLRAASLFGDAFWRGGVAALLGGVQDIEDHLDHLLRSEVIERRDASRIAGEAEYAFRHALVREAAYAMLTDEDRARGHARAGDYLERAGEQDHGMLAEHFERGEAPERALGHYRLAASRCVAGGDLPGAVARIERAHACGAFGQELGELRLLEGEVHIWRSQPDGAARCWREALSIFEEDSLSWWHAYCGLLTAHGLSGDVPAVGRLIIEIANRKLPVSVSAREVSRLSLLVQYFVSVGMRPTAAVLLGRLEPLGDTADPVVAAWVEWARQMFAVYTTGDPWLHREAARAALDNPHLQGEPFPLVLIRIELGLALTNLGLHAEGQAVLRECLAASLPLGAHLVTAVVELCLSRALLGTGDLEEAERLVLHARSAFPEGGLMWGGVQLQLARCRLQAGDLAGASREARRSRTPAFVSPAFDALSLAIEANARLLGGERDVVASTEESVRLLRDPERRFPAIELFVRFTHAEALHAHGDAAAARIEIQAVKAEILGRAALIPDPELRRAYLERVPENVLILAFAAAIDA